MATTAIPTDAHVAAPRRARALWTAAALRRAWAARWAIGGTALVLALWQLGVTLGGGNIVPSPLAVLRGIVELAGTGRLASYATDSLMRVGVGFGLALVTALPFGLALGYFPKLRIAANPVIQLLRPISPLAWTPIAVVAFGIGSAAPIFLIFLASFCAIAQASMHSVPMVSRIYVLAGSNFGLSRAAVFYRVVFPAALPSILNGLRIALGVAWIVVVAAEMIAVDSGLGYLIIDSRNAGKRYDLVVGGMVLIGVIGLVLDGLMLRLGRLPALRWSLNTRG